MIFCGGLAAKGNRVLDTPRLILRTFREEDSPALFAIYSDEKTKEHCHVTKT